jgi:hypothetical protein
VRAHFKLLPIDGGGCGIAAAFQNSIAEGLCHYIVTRDHDVLDQSEQQTRCQDIGDYADREHRSWL